MLGRTDSRLRLIALLSVLLVVSGALAVRLAYWQIARADDLQGRAATQLRQTDQEPAQRGDILDRHGRILATTAYRDLLAVYPDQLSEGSVPGMSRQLAKILGWSGARAAGLLSTLESRRTYAVLARELTAAQSEQIRAGISEGTLHGIDLQPRAVRFYPNPGGAPGTTLASHLIGFVDGQGAGQYGVERQYQAALAGEPRVIVDDGGVALSAAFRGGDVVQEGAPGQDIQLTIDASLQLQLEKELYAAWVANQAPRVSAIVLDPHTGEVLASASVPGYDANAYASIAGNSAGSFIDPIVSDVYEPGSVMKMALAAAAFEEDIVEPGTVMRDVASLRFGGARVDNADKRGMGEIPFEDVIAYSRNVSTARVALMLDGTVDGASHILFDMWQRLGFGQKTGIDVAGESAGLVADPDRSEWRPIDLANRAFGQGVAVTPIQLAVAAQTIANGGTRLQPHVVSAVGGRPVSLEPPRRVLDQPLADELRALMTHVVTEVPWYAQGTLIPGYTVGGKTGTAQIWDPEQQRWTSNTFNFSFMGFAGRTTPEAVIAVRIHETRPNIRGQGDFELGITSYQLFRRIAIDTLNALDVLPAGLKEMAPAPDPSRRPGRSQERTPDPGRDTARARP